MTTEIAPVANAPYGQLSFAALRAQGEATAVVNTAQLEKEKGRLVGVPHVITRVTYRPGITTPEGLAKDYVSVEAIVADAETLHYALSRGWIPGGEKGDLSTVPVSPEEHIVYNDGSTGVRRQLTNILHNVGLLEVPNVDQDMAVFDAPYWEWNGFAQTGLMNGEADDEKIEVPDFSQGATGAQLAIFVEHGLRISVFPNPANPKTMSEVFYLS